MSACTALAPAPELGGLPDRSGRRGAGRGRAVGAVPRRGGGFAAGGARARAGAVWLAALLAFALAPRLVAHPANLTAADAQIRADGRFTLRLTIDTLAYTLNDAPERIPDGDMRALLDGPRGELERRLGLAREHFVRHFRVEANGAPVPTRLIRFPTTDEVVRWKNAAVEPLLPVLLTCEVTGRLPAGSRTLAFQFPDIISNVVLTVERPGKEPYTEPVSGGIWSTRLPVRLAGTVVTRTADVTAGAAHATAGAADADEHGRWWDRVVGVAQFVRLGFEHIVPRGLDHILFVLGLFLLAQDLPTLLWQVTAFTLAHSVTLALSLYGVLRLPAGVVEPLIALSIVLVAVDNLRTTELHRWRIAVVFGFGLVHGLGFAGALRALGLPRGEFLGALVGFNLGVELGQLAVIGAAFAVVGWFRALPRYRRYVVIPASMVIAGVAVVWTVERIATGL